MTVSIQAGRKPVVLLVEDNDNDVELTRICMSRTRFNVDLRHVSNGRECMAYLRKEGSYAGAPDPDLVLLDLNMPGMDGRQVLSAIVADEKVRSVPVVVLTTSSDEKEVLDLYRLRCSSYLVKPVDLREFLRLLEVVTEYWFTAVVLPTGLADQAR